MLVSVACMGKDVSAHFGHCEHYLFCEVKDNKIVNEKFVESPVHVPGKLPVFLHEQGSNVIIAGGMGQKAVDIFNANEIEVVVGASGDAHESVLKYINCELKSTGSFCAGHDD